MPRYAFSTDAEAGPGRDLTRAAIFLLGEFVSDQDILFDLDLALTEASTNVVRHAYQEGQGKLSIELDIAPGSHVTLEVTDTGRGIDQERVTFDSPDPTREGGRGFFLMKRLTDAFALRREEGRTIISMRKNIGKQSWVRLT